MVEKGADHIVTLFFLAAAPFVTVHLFEHKIAQRVHGLLSFRAHLQMCLSAGMVDNVVYHGVDPFAMGMSQHVQQILRDLEFCCKATGDYEGAYRCAAKRLARKRTDE